jgi:predicted molibdopterin-dependent oxidoreductase YjgC
MLIEASHGRLGGLVLVGADPLADFPDAGLALRGMSGARFVVAVDTHLSESARRADVVLPAAAWAERRGTFTNIEGRITWLSQMVVEHAVSWSDWMIACELAARMGTNMAFTRLEDIWEEIERVSPLHHGLPYEVLSGLRARDGVVVPPDSAVLSAPVPPRPLDPMADPGIASAELHKIAPSALLVTSVDMLPEYGSSAPTDRVAYPAPPESGAEGEGIPSVPNRLGLPPVPAPATTPAGDGLRLVSRRTMWDGGTQVQASDYLAALAPESTIRLNPAVLAELGAADGEKVVVRSNRGTLTLPAAADPTLPAGSAVIPWNLPGGRAGDLIDCSAVVTTVTVEASGGDD